MLEALKKCAEESGLIEMNMPSDPEEYFTYLCKIYYCMECNGVDEKDRNVTRK